MVSKIDSSSDPDSRDDDAKLIKSHPPPGSQVIEDSVDAAVGVIRYENSRLRWDGLSKITVLALMMSLVGLSSTVTFFLVKAKPMSFQRGWGTTSTARPPMGGTLSADISVYPGYDGPLVPRGRVTVRFEHDDNEFLFRYELDGLEENCDNCGIYIHEGMSCDDPGSVGGHYWNHTQYDQDPWMNSVYHSTEGGSTSNAFVMVSGTGHEDTKGRVIVVESQDGTRIGCGLLDLRWKMNALIADIGPYPGLIQPSQKLSGTVRAIAYEDGVMRVHASLKGLESNCINCGVHFHQGLTCEDPDMIGGHHWEKSEMVSDPWGTEKATYTSDTSGTAERYFYLYNGYDFEDNIDHAVVVHAQDGTRIGCGLLRSDEHPWHHHDHV